MAEADLEGRLRYAEFHRRAAVVQRQRVILELRDLQARLARGVTTPPATRLGFVRLHWRLALNRARPRLTNIGQHARR